MTFSRKVVSETNYSLGACNYDEEGSENKEAKGTEQVRGCSTVNHSILLRHVKDQKKRENRIIIIFMRQ